MQELLFWCIVIPVMSVIGTILAFRSHRPMYERLPSIIEDTMGMVPPRFIPPRDTSIDASLIYDIHEAIPERGTLLNRPPNPYLDIMIRPHDRSAVWLESFMLAIGAFLLRLWHTLTEREELPTYRGYQPIETGERSEPPQGGSVLYRRFGDSGELAVIPSTGYTPLLDDDPYKHEEETGNEDDCETWNQALLRNIGQPPVPQIDPLSAESLLNRPVNHRLSVRYRR